MSWRRGELTAEGSLLGLGGLYGLLHNLLGLIDRHLSGRLNRSGLDRLNGCNGLGGSRWRVVTLRDREVRNGGDLVGELRHHRADACHVGIVRPLLRNLRYDVQGDSLSDQRFGIESDCRRSSEP